MNILKTKIFEFKEKISKIISKYFLFVPYKQILTKIPQPIMVVDGNDNLVFKNQALIQLEDVLRISVIDSIILKQFIAQDSILKTCLQFSGQEILVEKWLEKKYIMIAFELSEQKKIYQIGKDFVANASHELRTPITIIKGFAETLQDLPSISDSMLNDFTSKILRSCQRMDSLVKNLLLLADLDHSKRIQRRSCDILGLIESVNYTVLGLHPEIWIETFTSHEEIEFPLDPDMLEQALINLLENAVKYSHKPAKITIIVEKKEKEIILKIQDRGIGISKEHLPYVFNRFYRVNQDRSRKLGGAGLGLSIVKAIIEKHHGQICVYSQPEEGTTFEIVFPRY